jgi:elongation factor 1-alpha
MVLLDKNLSPTPVRTFKAQVKVLHHPTTMRVGYTPVIHAHTIRQTAKIIEMSKEALRTGDIADVTFQFIMRPEYLEKNETFVFREGKTRGIGTVEEVFSD